MLHPTIRFPLDYVPSVSSGQEFGADRTQFGGTTHKGIDLQGPHKSKLYAGFDGKLTVTQSLCGGTTSRIDGGDILKDSRSWSVRGVHLHSVIVPNGSNVKKGQHIGYTDNTGQCTTGTHLHYEVLVNGTPINPRFVHPELGGSEGVDPMFVLPTWETLVAFWWPGQTTGQALFDFCVQDGHLEHIASEHIYAPATSTSLATMMNRHLLAHFGDLDNQDMVTMDNYIEFWHPGKNKAHAVWDFSLWHFTHICMFLHPDLPFYNAQAKEVDNHLRRDFGIPLNPIWTNGTP